MSKHEIDHAVNMDLSPEILESLITKGDLSGLNPKQRAEYYTAFCGRIGLDPATQPFAVLTLQGKTKLYADRGCAAQLNKLYKVSHQILNREIVEGIYVVTAKAFQPDGRQTESIGAVSMAGLKGLDLANAMMKAETKSKRRSTLDLIGLGIMDESEIEDLHIDAVTRAAAIEVPPPVAAASPAQPPPIPTPPATPPAAPKLADKGPTPAATPAPAAAPTPPAPAAAATPPPVPAEEKKQFAPETPRQKQIVEFRKALADKGITEEFAINLLRGAKLCTDEVKSIENMEDGLLETCLGQKFFARIIKRWEEAKAKAATPAA